MGKTSHGYEVAMSVHPDYSNDVCTFCKHMKASDSDFWVGKVPICKLGHTPYFRSLSDCGPVWVSDCGAGEPREGIPPPLPRPEE